MHCWMSFRTVYDKKSRASQRMVTGSDERRTSHLLHCASLIGLGPAAERHDDAHSVQVPREDPRLRDRVGVSVCTRVGATCKHAFQTCADTTHRLEWS